MAYSFYVATKSRMNKAARAGRANGRITLKNSLKLPHPSIRAGASSSRGMVRKNP
jgi:hypothetical protein